MAGTSRAQFLGIDRQIGGVLLVLAVAQVFGWGTLGLPAIAGHRIAADLHVSLPMVFGGTSTLYVTMGLCGPLLADRKSVV